MLRPIKSGISRFLFITSALLLFHNSSYSSGVVGNLMVEYANNPVGIDVPNPRFGWQMIPSEGERGLFQSAYRIVVTEINGTLVWDSGKTESGISAGISYKGDPLKPSTRYNFSVTVWDNSSVSSSAVSWFETGLMDPGISAWEGARWIGGGPEDLVLQSHYLTVFRVSFKIELDRESESTKASFVLGANDSRLMDRNKNIYNIESTLNESYIKFELDVSELAASTDTSASLNIYRAGYHPEDDPSKPFISIAVPADIINRGNMYLPHTIFIESVFGTLNIFIDGKGQSNRLALRSQPDQGRPGRGGININPVGQGGNYISFPLLADIGFSADKGQKAAFSDVTVTNLREPSNILFSENFSKEDYHGIFSGFSINPGSGLSVEGRKYIIDGGERGVFFAADPGRNSMPMLRTEFAASEGIAGARLYVTARGIYEVYLNGKRVGDDYFNPGLTQYNITHMYQTYDVTGMLVPGEENVLGAWLGEGWWSGNSTFTGSNWNFFGDRQSLLAKLVITYSDGSRKVITTNENDWKFFNNGPLVYGSFFQGEFYDSGKESLIEGWDKPGFNDKGWKPAVVIPLEGTAFTGTIAAQPDPRQGTGLSWKKMSLTGQIGNNAGIIKELAAVGMKQVRPGVYVYDMGQNMVGIPEIRINNSEKGKRITLRYAEVLYPETDQYGDNSGMIMLENIRAALAQDVYIAKAGMNIIRPRFTFHGYRYIEISGVDTPPDLKDVRGLVISSVRETTAAYETSNEKVNRLFDNILWSLYGNFLSIPTDCPQRNERMGWSGDISVFSRTATYLAGVNQFFRRHLMAMRDTQNSNGRFGDVAPVGGGFGGVLWGSAGMTVAWEAYEQYGDVEILKEHYNSMVAYIDYLAGTLSKETGISSDGALGDWLGPQNNQLGQAFLTPRHIMFSTWIMTRTAEIIGKNEDAARFRKMYQERKDFFNEKFVNPDHRTLGLIGGGGFGSSQARAPEMKLADTQTSYAVGLALDAFSETNKPYAVRSLVSACERENKDDGGVIRPPFSLMTGFIGTAWITKALSDNGHSETAYRLLQQESYPSWLYPVNNGATSIWERLNSYTVEDGFGGNNSMNSFNHYSFGAVGQWMIGYSLGIQRDEPGFRRFILKPEPDPTGTMTRASGHYDSMYGKIKSSWKNDNGSLSFSFTVPANTGARLFLPANSAGIIREGGKKLKKARGVTFVKYEDGHAVLDLASGDYSFTSEW